MEVKHNYSEKNGIFYLEDEGRQIGKMEYVMAGEKKMVIDHTVVDGIYEGKGLGRQLVKAGVEFARGKGYKIQPLCSYAKAVIDKTPEYQDLLF